MTFLAAIDLPAPAFIEGEMFVELLALLNFCRFGCLRLPFIEFVKTDYLVMESLCFLCAMPSGED